MTCELCPRHCNLVEEQTGFCGARANLGGAITCLNYGRLTALALDPVEKKPLRRFHPGAYLLSAGSFGCNLRCPFCQNHDIAMADARCPTTNISPGELVAKALALLPQGNVGIAYTYNEPLVGYEYVRDCASLARESGLQNVLVTNGYVCPDPLDRLLPLIDAMNIDLKGFTPSFYQLVGGDLETVKTTIAHAVKICHVEVTTLVIPGLNDSDAEMEAEADWLASLHPDIPLHISRFFPRYHMTDRPPTPVQTIERLVNIASKKLHYVYKGNC